MEQDVESRSAGTSGKKYLTIFTVVKPFIGKSETHQRNAICSWLNLGPHVEVLLFFDSPIPDDLRGVQSFEIQERNRHGTPLLSEIFQKANDVARSSVLAYINADIILGEDFLRAIRKLDDSELGEWLAIGCRHDLEVDSLINFENESSWQAELLESAASKTKKASIVCKDYFIFPKGLFEQIPDFAVGRGNWDNWIVAHAKSLGLPVVDISQCVTAIHQNHDYSHVKGGRFAAYVHGDEAKENQRLAGGRNLIRGSTPTWILNDEGVRKSRSGNWTFWKDSLNFLRLVGNLLFFRR
ncbi:MAG TPA: hypothetical protein PKD64_01990 [Pirellulaceae bacterium]|nr:hypothetical protein [Pirellulaceae bacterium]HMO90941.1 hypothetical protein [Pirellulaceae bacterium]HMP69840.1 hypothetical protein [Pirellulaceae bacterium]